MCELLCVSSRIPTTVSLSLQKFAARGGLDGRTLDGWGVAFYDGRDARVFREPEPARDSAWVPFIGHRQLRSSIVLSHLRHATQGARTLANTQPFQRVIGGRVHCFAHNGRLAGIAPRHAGHAEDFQPIGATDSELAACVIWERMQRLWAQEPSPSIPARLAVFRDFCEQMRALGPANFLYSDSEIVLAHGHRRTQADGQIAPPGLWRLQRRCRVDRDGLADAGVELGTHAEGQSLLLLASVPLSDEPWEPLAEGEVVAVRNGNVEADQAQV